MAGTAMSRNLVFILLISSNFVPAGRSLWLTFIPQMIFLLYKLCHWASECLIWAKKCHRDGMCISQVLGLNRSNVACWGLICVCTPRKWYHHVPFADMSTDSQYSWCQTNLLFEHFRTLATPVHPKTGLRLGLIMPLQNRTKIMVSVYSFC